MSTDILIVMTWREAVLQHVVGGRDRGCGSTSHNTQDSPPSTTKTYLTPNMKSTEVERFYSNEVKNGSQ